MTESTAVVSVRSPACCMCDDSKGAGRKCTYTAVLSHVRPGCGYFYNVTARCNGCQNKVTFLMNLDCPWERDPYLESDVVDAHADHMEDGSF